MRGEEMEMWTNEWENDLGILQILDSFRKGYFDSSLNAKFEVFFYSLKKYDMAVTVIINVA